MRSAMSELGKIIYTACATLIGGVLLLVAGQIITRFVIDPLVEFRRLLGEIAATLLLHSNLLFNPSTQDTHSQQFEQARADCRKLASRAHALSAAVPVYSLFAELGIVPEHSKVYEMAKALIGLSNTRSDTPVAQVVQKHYNAISTCLGIRVDDVKQQ